MRIAIIGAGGFVGAALVRRLAGHADLALIDRVPMEVPAGAQGFVGDFGDPALRARALDGADAVIHLAAILGGAAEADPARARRVNVDATLDLIDHVSAHNPRTRFVFASTIAVFGRSLPDPVSDDTPCAPVMVYGAHKRMIEVALENTAARGVLDAVSLRPSGVMARDGADAALKSAFLSRMFWCVARGQDIVLPVAEDSRTWLCSVDAVAANFAHAALLPDLGARRSLTLPALALTFGDLVAALRRRFPESPARVIFAPEAQTVALFGAFPRLETAAADALGFIRDADAEALVRSAMI